MYEVKCRAIQAAHADRLHSNHLRSSSQANVTDMSAHRFRLGALHVSGPRSLAQPPARLSRLRAHVPHDINEIVEQLSRIDNFYLMMITNDIIDRDASMAGFRGKIE